MSVRSSDRLVKEPSQSVLTANGSVDAGPPKAKAAGGGSAARFFLVRVALLFAPCARPYSGARETGPGFRPSREITKGIHALWRLLDSDRARDVRRAFERRWRQCAGMSHELLSVFLERGGPHRSREPRLLLESGGGPSEHLSAQFLQMRLERGGKGRSRPSRLLLESALS